MISGCARHASRTATAASTKTRSYFLYLQTLATVDQLNLPTLVGLELLVTRRAPIREAHRLSPHAGLLLGSPLHGLERRKCPGAVNEALTKHMPECLRNEAAVIKESREACEERQLRATPTPPHPTIKKGVGSHVLGPRCRG